VHDEPAFERSGDHPQVLPPLLHLALAQTGHLGGVEERQQCGCVTTSGDLSRQLPPSPPPPPRLPVHDRRLLRWRRWRPPPLLWWRRRLPVWRRREWSIPPPCASGGSPDGCGRGTVLVEPGGEHCGAFSGHAHHHSHLPPHQQLLQRVSQHQGAHKAEDAGGCRNL